MYKKLLKRLAGYVMAAALCAGMFAPLQAEAASKKDVVGTWEGTWFGRVIFSEDGKATDPWNTAEYYMESGTVYVNTYDDDFAYDFYRSWDGETPTTVSKGSNVTLYKLNGDGTITMLNAVNRSGSGALELDCADILSRVVDEKKSEKKKEDPVEAAKKAEERKALEEARRESVRMAAEAAEKGFADMAQMQEAEAGGKSADEYYNNAVVNTEGIENAVPVAQGGGLIVDGEETNMTAAISKVSSFYVNSVRAAREGTVLNVVDVQFPAKAAVVNFYMPGVVQGEAVTAAQYVDGAWIDVQVVEVRADHVVLNLQNNGIVAFLAN